MEAVPHEHLYVFALRHGSNELLYKQLGAPAVNILHRQWYYTAMEHKDEPWAYT